VNTMDPRHPPPSPPDNLAPFQGHGQRTEARMREVSGSVHFLTRCLH
jgi:hypothetical protein